MARVFVYEGREHADPDPTLSVDEVKQMFAAFFPEVATAEVRTTQRGEDEVHEFVRRVGVKGNQKMGWHRLLVTIQCERCQSLLYRVVWKRYQTKGGRWDGGIHITAEAIEPHTCQG